MGLSCQHGVIAQTFHLGCRYALLLFAVLSSGCAFGPRALEQSHGRYNQAVKEVEDEQLLLNMVRLRYNE